MLVPLLLLFILVPIAELSVIIQVGQQIGVLWTIAILIADSILGSMLMRSQGRAAWRRFNVALQSGRPPAREVLDGVLVIFGGALLLTPGLPHRHLRARLPAPAHPRGGAADPRPPLRRPDDRLGRAPRAAARARRRAPTDVEGTAVDVDADSLPRGSR